MSYNFSELVVLIISIIVLISNNAIWVLPKPPLKL